MAGSSFFGNGSDILPAQRQVSTLIRGLSRKYNLIQDQCEQQWLLFNGLIRGLSRKYNLIQDQCERQWLIMAPFQAYKIRQIVSQRNSIWLKSTKVYLPLANLKFEADYQRYNLSPNQVK